MSRIMSQTMSRSMIDDLLKPSRSHFSEGRIWGWIDPLNSPEEGPSPKDIILPVQTHSCNIREVDAAGKPIDGEGLEDTDALITRQKGIVIGVRTADCVPILLFAPDIMAVAAIHAGWKGTLGRIAGLTVERLVAMGGDPAKINALIANCICPDCYEVGEELASEFVKYPALVPCISYGGFTDPLGLREFDTANPHLDLLLANRIILTRAGLIPENISTTGICTRHSPLRLPSWRREPGTTRRMITWIHLPK